MRRKEQQNGRRRRGNAAVEVALISPWIFLLFVGIFDAGFYTYAGICTANAARVAALYTSSGHSTLADSWGACNAALREMYELPNVKDAVGCPLACGAGTVCTAGPVKFTAIAKGSAASGLPLSADGSPASEVTVQYDTVQLLPIPGLAGKMTLKRVVQMRQRL
jgi:Flp pilus assembly protein TadG